jgi:sugar lactone lactonase YvrE
MATRGPERRSRFARACVGAAVIFALAACSGTSTPATTATTAVTGLESTAAPASPVLGPIDALSAHLVGPIELAIARDGALIVSQCTFEVGQAFIDRIASDGTMTRLAGTGQPGFSGDGGAATSALIECPAGMAFGPDGALYFADHANNRIRRIDASGTITTIAGSGPTGVNMGSFSGDGAAATNATLQEPWGIAFDGAGNLYIADRDNNRVRRVDPAGRITTVAGTGESDYSGDGGPALEARLCGPQGLAIDGAGDLFIADDCNDRVRRVDHDGRITTVAGTGVGGFSGDGGSATSAKIDGPDGLTFGRDGALYVATNPGLRIRRIDTGGRISTIAGTGAAGVAPEGSRAIDAPFLELYGLVFDSVGNLDVADGNASIFQVSLDGLVRRLAGAP